MARTRSLGFTLTELAITVALVGLLAGLAIPGYRAQLMRAHRLEAMRALLAVAAEQERFHLVHGRYADELGAAADAEPPGLTAPASSESGRYQLGVALASTSTYRLWARPARGGPQQADEACALFTLDAEGRRGASSMDGRPATSCWR
ncbi:MAG: prepilin-type N-terminal cleavage/methylation domain-containing protein [Gammaproteobacteria bacterium]|nr:prepilin-type N-terminal cleavage/methylation domain-containing protein [Gammaproteobacteria bacterium]